MYVELPLNLCSNMLFTVNDASEFTSAASIRYNTLLNVAIIHIARLLFRGPMRFANASSY